MKTLVILHGWGMMPAVFDDLASRLSPLCAVRALALPGYCGAPEDPADTLQALASNVASRAPARCVVAGWSLGGHVALEWARSRPQQIEALALIASTPSFVQREGWPHAVAPAVFERFAAEMMTNRQRSLERFASLQAQGEPALRTTLARLRGAVCACGDASTATLQRGLRVLLDTDLRASLERIEHEAVVIHGECDHLVPSAAGQSLAQGLKRARFCAIPHSAHAPFVAQPEAVAQALKALL